MCEVMQTAEQRVERLVVGLHVVQELLQLQLPAVDHGEGGMGQGRKVGEGGVWQGGPGQAEKT